jgi:tagaturonate reductase
VALLAGLEAVGPAVDDQGVGLFLRAAIDDEIIPALASDDAHRKELQAFAADVLLRFRNPSIHHRLASIALNSWSKFAARVMPQLLRYIALNAGRMPRRLVLALAATMVLYRGGTIALSDDQAKLDWFAQAWAKVDGGEWSLAQLASGWLANGALWGRDLNEVPGLTYALTVALDQIGKQGMRELLA